ncbi:MAG: rhodanese-like domain-containing protein [Peptostreptococcaceae bacterium]
MYINIDKTKLNKMLNSKDDVLLLDIRTKEEFEEKSIPEAINMPLSTLLFNISEIEEYKNKIVIIYCRSGHRSITACSLLSMEGFEKLYNLEKGILEY